MKGSRRIMLKNAAIVAGLVAAPWARSALDDGKATKQAMHYQDQPKDGQNCTHMHSIHPRREAGRERRMPDRGGTHQPQRLVYRVHQEKLAALIPALNARPACIVKKS